MSSWLRRQANKRADHPAFYWQDECWSFADLYQEVQLWMAEFTKAIPSSEKRIALFGRNSKEMYFSILALWELGKEIVFLNSHLRMKELAYQLTDADVNWVIADSKHSAYLSQLAQVRLLEMKRSETSHDVAIQESAYQAKSIASIMYTSGTTGYPKGVVQCFSNHLASALATQENMRVTADDCWLCAVPLFHISGLSIVVRQLVLGCSIRLYDRFDNRIVTDDLRRGKGTIISVVSLMLYQLLENYPDEGYDPQFKTALLGGGPIATKALAKCEELGIPVIQSYGMTETCSQVVALNFSDAAEKIGSVGKPLVGMAVKIINEQSQALAPNQVGEVLLKGNNVIQHYLNDEQWRATKWTADGWFKTGDAGYLDNDGYLYLVSRLSELIISGGENIYPTEVEHALQEMPGIKEIAIVGEYDKKWGAVPVAYIVGDATITVEKINAFAQTYLAKFKRPKKIYFCDALPKTANGKLAKYRLTTKSKTILGSERP